MFFHFVQSGAYLHKNFSDDNIVVVLENRAEDNGDSVLLGFDVSKIKTITKMQKMTIYK